MESLLWLSIASALVYALLGGCGLALRIGRPQEPEYGLASTIGFALFAFASARAVQIAWPNEVDPFSLVADVAALGAFVASAHFVILHFPRETCSPLDPGILRDRLVLRSLRGLG